MGAGQCGRTPLRLDAAWVVSRRRVAGLVRIASPRAKAVRGYRGFVGAHRF